MTTTTRALSEITYEDFWLSYLRAHSRKLTRQWHYVGITIIHVGIAAAIWMEMWWIAGVSVALGYACAWAGHYSVEGNEPMAFKGPKMALWSLASALRMYYSGMILQLGADLERAGVEET